MRKLIRNGHWSYGPYRIRRQSAAGKSYIAGFGRYLNGQYIDWHQGLREAERACDESLKAGNTSATTASGETDTPSAA